MKNLKNKDLLIIDFLTVILLLSVLISPWNPLRIILGLPLLAFFPGYVLSQAIFAGRGMETMKRMGISLALSAGIVPVNGLILNALPWGLTLETVLFSLAVFVFIVTVIAWLRRRHLAEAAGQSQQQGLLFLRGAGAVSKILGVALIIVAVGAVGLMGYVVAGPRLEQKFSEFYLLGADGGLQGYPKTFVWNGTQYTAVELDDGRTQNIAEGILTVVISNHEKQPATYAVRLSVNSQPVAVLADGRQAAEIGPITLADGEKWQKRISFLPIQGIESQKVDFTLYKDGVQYLDTLKVPVEVREQK